MITSSLTKRAQTAAVCGQSYRWMFNSLDQSPCLIAAHAQGACSNGEWNVKALPQGFKYESPSGSTANLCSCSWAVYNLMSACAVCQGIEGGTDTWSAWVSKCPGEVRTNSTFWPDAIVFPDTSAIPFYATTNPTKWSSARFDTNAAKSIAQEGHADAKGPPLPKKTTNNIGPIVGGVVGGGSVLILAAIAAYFLIIKKRRRQQESVHSAPDVHYGVGPQANEMEKLNAHGRSFSGSSLRDALGFGYARLSGAGSPSTGYPNGSSSVTMSPGVPPPPMSPATVQTHSTASSGGNSLAYFSANPGGLQSPGSPGPSGQTNTLLGVIGSTTPSPPPGIPTSSSPPPAGQGHGHRHTSSTLSNPESQIQPFTLQPHQTTWTPDRKHPLGPGAEDGNVFPVYSEPNRPPDERTSVIGGFGYPMVGLGRPGGADSESDADRSSSAGVPVPGGSNLGGVAPGAGRRLNPPPYSVDGYAGGGNGGAFYSSGVGAAHMHHQRQQAGRGDLVLASTPMRPEKGGTVHVKNASVDTLQSASSRPSDTSRIAVQTSHLAQGQGTQLSPAAISPLSPAGATSVTHASSGREFLHNLRPEMPSSSGHGETITTTGTIGTGFSGHMQVQSSHQAERVQTSLATQQSGGRVQLANPDPSIDGRSIEL